MLRYERTPHVISAPKNVCLGQTHTQLALITSYVQKSKADVLVQKKSKAKKKNPVDGAFRTSETTFPSTAVRHLRYSSARTSGKSCFSRNLNHIAGSPTAYSSREACYTGTTAYTAVLLENAIWSILVRQQ